KKSARYPVTRRFDKTVKLFENEINYPDWVIVNMSIFYFQGWLWPGSHHGLIFHPFQREWSARPNFPSGNKRSQIIWGRLDRVLATLSEYKWSVDTAALSNPSERPQFTIWIVRRYPKRG